MGELLVELSEAAHKDSEADHGSNGDSTPWFIQNIEVSGHAGIGETAVNIPVLPKRGVLIVSARNGVGKTSIADAVRHVMSNGARRGYEIAETNLHFPSRRIVVTISNGKDVVDLACSGDGRVEWRQVGVVNSTVNEKWNKAYQLYRPVLLYPEISPFIERPEDLHDFLKGGLPLDVLEELQKRVDDVRAQGRDAKREIEAAYSTALAAAAAVQDSTLYECIETARAIPEPEAIATVRALSERPSELATRAVPIPPKWEIDLEIVEQCCSLMGRLRVAQAKIPDTAESLHSALSHLLSKKHPEGICPICGSEGVEWSDTARARLNALDSDLAEYRKIKLLVASSMSKVLDVVPTRLSPDFERAFEKADQSGQLLKAWEHLARSRSNLTVGQVTEAELRSWVSEATALADGLEPYRRKVQESRDQSVVRRSEATKKIESWLDAVDRRAGAVKRGETADRLDKQVVKWTKTTRDELFRPIAESVQDIWSRLSIDTDLAVTDVALAGGTRRAGKVSIGLSMGGISIPSTDRPTNILSTGQRNSLTLATYFPRAMQPDSPFGFLVLDDPVHSFDFGRVQYLASLLADLSDGRQIIVFTHDDRLWHELRALGIWAEHIRLDRVLGEDSVVRVSDATAPGLRHLDDLLETINSPTARDLATKEALSSLVLAMCRQALDAEVWTQVEILARRARVDQRTVDQRREHAGDSRGQLNLLNSYADQLGISPVDLTGFERTINALNSGAHGNAEKSNNWQRREWIKQTRELIAMVRKMSEQF
ncbi:hypothetical protein ABZS66_08515 [Dactylosporangium sp. NPDC005572]|uniref:AAA family ATPase n=1 Tax=Dactylosporangium sp. NPDC005572 TaxID=3156889 RepID=UPI0033B18DFE